jgi:hypothetical protein
VLGVSLAVVAGLFSATIFGVGPIKNTIQTAPDASALFTGHVTLTATDPSGNIKAYRQTDNLVVNQGENCALKLLFQESPGAAGNTVCTGINSKGYKIIAIGNSTNAVASDHYILPGRHLAADNSTHKAITGLAAKQATTTTWTNSTTSGTGTTASVVQSATFTNTAATAQTVSESGLFNSTNDDSNTMFARQTFTTISLNPNDALTVQWTVTLGGTTNALSP